MRCRRLPSAVLATLAASFVAAAAPAAETTVAPPPVAHAILSLLARQPGELEQAVSHRTEMLRPARRPPGRPPLANASWQLLLGRVPLNPGSMLLLRDGTVLVQDMGKEGAGTGRWWRLTPDIEGDYANGAW